MNILSLENVGLTYQTKLGETEAIKNLSFNVAEGEFTAIIGPSGCGKTSILSLIAGLIPKSSGSIKLYDKEITEPSEQIGYMLQRDELFYWRTIAKNVLLPLEIKKKMTAENVAYALGLLDKYGLKEFKSYYPKQLSGGMKQRAALIRTLSGSPDLLLLDEPFSALDYQTRLNVCDDVYSIIRKENKTAVLVTHDISEAISLADTIIVLTKRPAAVLTRHVITFDKSLSPLKRREEKEFSKWFETLWGELHV